MHRLDMGISAKEKRPLVASYLFNLFILRNIVNIVDRICVKEAALARKLAIKHPSPSGTTIMRTTEIDEFKALVGNRN